MFRAVGCLSRWAAFQRPTDKLMSGHSFLNTTVSPQTLSHTRSQGLYEDWISGSFERGVLSGNANVCDFIPIIVIIANYTMRCSAFCPVKLFHFTAYFLNLPIRQG